MIRLATSAHAGLGAQLAQLVRGEILRSRESGWESASFCGARHRYVIGVARPLDMLSLDGIEEREFRIPGHFVADVALVARSQDPATCRLVFEALTGEDC